MSQPLGVVSSGVFSTNDPDHPVTRIKRRDGKLVPVDLNKIVGVINGCAVGLAHVDPTRVAVKTVGGIFDGATTRQLDELSITTATMLILEEPEYSKLAARLLARVIHEEAPTGPFSKVMGDMHALGRINDRTHDFVVRHTRALDAALDDTRDDEFEYFGLKTVYDRYLLRHPEVDEVLETPQRFFMRIACALSRTLKDALSIYEALSTLRYLPGSPTLFNAGTNYEQCSSCFLVDSPQDNIGAIYKGYSDVAYLSKFAGGIGKAYSRVRSRGSKIKSTNGKSNGIVPWLKILDSSIGAVNQGGKRKGACAVYLEPWHADIEDFLELRNNTGDEASRTHNLNLVNWIPDLFMKRVVSGGQWSLFDPKVTPDLPDLYGAEFEAAYEAYEVKGVAVRTVPARDLYGKMIRTLAQFGQGWMTFKDRCNETSNQTGVKGNVIHLSNLCVAPETLVLTDKGEFPIVDLVDQQVNVWNGKQFSETTVRKTGENQRLLRVTLTGQGNRVLYCTAYHKFIVKGGTRVAAMCLTPGDELAPWNMPDGITHYGKILNVEPLTEPSDTYCFNEPLEHAGVFNGILTGNCTEILQVSSEKETAVCNIGSINLSKFLKGFEFDFDALADAVKTAVRALDRVINVNFYTIPETAASNARWRPVGLGLMGLQDVFFQMRLAFDSPKALELSNKISEEIYFHALTASCDLSEELGPHKAFSETKAAQGKLQFDAWNVSPKDTARWTKLRNRVMHHGLRNSLLIAIAPTATIASIAGCYECIEPMLSNQFKRETMSGDFLQVNRYLVDELRHLGVWNDQMRLKIKMANGSIQGITELPEETRKLFRTVWEYSMKTLIDMAAGRGPYLDQSQSLNLFMESPSIGAVSSMYMYAWQKGLKTTYYLRSRPATQIMKTVSEAVVEKKTYTEDEVLVCSLENPDACEACQ